MISSKKAQSAFAVLIWLFMTFLIFLFATPFIFEILSINNPGGATGFVLAISPALILLIILVRFIRTGGQGRILG